MKGPTADAHDVGPEAGFKGKGSQLMLVMLALRPALRQRGPQLMLMMLALGPALQIIISIHELLVSCKMP